MKDLSVFNPSGFSSIVLFTSLFVCMVMLPLRSAYPADDPVRDCETGEPVEINDSIKIGDIKIDNQNVFDLNDPRENNALYRLINYLHILTREDVVRQRMLLRPGDPFSLRLLKESERLERAPPYIYDAYICVRKIEDDRVHLDLVTRDVWTLKPGITASRKGGKNSSSFVVEEGNFLGRGIQLNLGRIADVDRNSNIFSIKDQNILGSWISGELDVGDNSDGNHLTLNVEQPFYSFDSRFAWDLNYVNEKRIEPLYDRGEVVNEFRQKQIFQRAAYGWSTGYQNGWTSRMKVGIIHDFINFSQVTNSDINTLTPTDRYFQYPFVNFEKLQDRFEVERNRDQMGRAEDFFLGTQIAATLGLMSKALGSDRDGLIFQSDWKYSLLRSDEAHLLTDGDLSGRWESRTGFVNSLVSANLRYYYRQSSRRSFYTSIEGAIGQGLDLDNLLELGGDNGLRGYPLRYQTGDKRALLTIEQRYFTTWYPFRLMYVGGAAFLDIGRVWGNNPVGDRNLGLLRDIGFGLRLSSSRSDSGAVVHIDISFPLDGDASISNKQFTVETKKSF